MRKGPPAAYPPLCSCFSRPEAPVWVRPHLAAWGELVRNGGDSLWGAGLREGGSPLQVGEKSRRFFFPKETFMSHVYFESTYLFGKYQKKTNHLASYKAVKSPRILVTQAGKRTSGVFLMEVLASVFVCVRGSFSHPTPLIRRVESKFARFWVACVHSGLLPAESGHCGHLHGAHPPGGGGQVRAQRLLHRLRRYLSVHERGFWLHVMWPTPPSAPSPGSLAWEGWGVG